MHDAEAVFAAQAIAAYEAVNPHGADWWAGKKEAADGVRDTTNDQPKEPK